MFADDNYYYYYDYYYDYYKVTLWTAVPRLAVKKSVDTFSCEIFPTCSKKTCETRSDKV